MTKENNFEKLRAKIIVRAWKDPRFKEKLLKNPRAAFKEMGLDLPENFKIQVMEDKATDWTFVLPETPLQVHQLSDDELENIAGGNNQRRTTTPYPCSYAASCRGGR